ncbi:SgcJ/EcaC family oxidoreductase [Glaesserella sp.]|uniref:SgcJ/EcaC family oxidoreductase n=1 Tax=Glaesserella sp. TaxID=2094731 RepID=UPI00359F4B9B
MKKFLCMFTATTLLAACTSSSSSDTATATACKAVTKQEIARLFDRWNASLQSGDPKKVVANYAPDSILLPTVSNKVRFTAEEKEDYFHHFLEYKPKGSIDLSYIQIGCNSAFDAGLYTFTYAKTGEKASGRYSFNYKWDGKEWLITEHHSSLMPETK